ncbi:MAG: rRNA maturation RNase YbeY [Caldisericia bacterium]|nr:rRNA maturation RNase YbeY [Caldisericia bacterium]MDD4613963.1 rRNA maturation RNase YbeY [Caldisericia bacterium]
MTSIDYSVDDAVPDLPLEYIATKVDVLVSHPMFSQFPKESVISVAFVHDSTMTELNHSYRGKNQSTDILTFVYNELLENSILLGEIIVCTDQAKRDAQEEHISLEQEYVWLFSHGLLHLLGYDHETDEEFQHMRKLELELMKYADVNYIERGDY